MKVVITDTAEVDLEAIGDHIAQDNPTREVTFVQELVESCGKLATMPQAYPLVPRYGETGIRRQLHGDYLIFYRIGEDRIEILHILHGARDYEAILFPRT